MSVTKMRVLIVDDSAFMRRMLKEILQREPDIEVVGVAADGKEALSKAATLRPDIITLDLVMPQLDGIGFLREQNRRIRIPVLIVSVLEEEHDLALTALELGALDIVKKPSGIASTTVFDMARELVEKIRIGRETPPFPASPEAEAAFSNRVSAPDAPALPKSPASTGEKTAPAIVLVGTSTGGPHALREILPYLPASFPLPVVVAIHMPSGYTRSFAERLDVDCPLEVAEAAEGDVVVPGRILIAPAGVHTRFEQSDDEVVIRLSAQPFELPHRPSVDILFSTAADVYGAATLAYVLTGMGEDGAKGAKKIFERGGKIFAEAQESCIVYGMPRAAVEAGVVERILPLSGIAAQMRLLGSQVHH